MPVIVARYESKCSACGLKIVVGERINYTRSTKGQHLTCGDDRDDPETAIRTAYKVWRESPSFDDQRAFDECEREFGYVHAVKALYSVSPIAKQKEDAYQNHVAYNRMRGAARRGGFTFR